MRVRPRLTPLHRLLWLAVALAVGGLGSGLGVALPAAAHSALVDAEPGPDDVTGVETDRIRLQFESLDPDGAQEVRVTDSGGEDHARAVRVQGFDTLLVDLTALQVGPHEVTYTITPADGHRLRGSYRFDVLPTGAARDDDRDLTPVVGGAVLLSAVVAVAVLMVLRSRRRPGAEAAPTDAARPGA